MDRIDPDTTARRSPRFKRVPLGTSGRKSNFGSTALMTISAAGSPARTPAARAANAARPIQSGGIKARVVRSPAVPKSSRRAKSTSARLAAASAGENGVMAVRVTGQRSVVKRSLLPFLLHHPIEQLLRRVRLIPAVVADARVFGELRVAPCLLDRRNHLRHRSLRRRIRVAPETP